MGYEVHITRAPEWFDSESFPISRELWEEYVDRCSDLEFVTSENERLYGPGNDGSAVWIGHPKNKSGDYPIYFVHSGEHISVKATDDEVIRRALQAASEIDARVQGDEGEFYVNADNLCGYGIVGEDGKIKSSLGGILVRYFARLRS